MQDIYYKKDPVMRKGSNNFNSTITNKENGKKL